jgi:hypothetical protein
LGKFTAPNLLGEKFFNLLAQIGQRSTVVERAVKLLDRFKFLAEL